MDRIKTPTGKISLSGQINYKPMFLATGIYFALAAVFLFVTFYFFNQLSTPEDARKNISLSYIIIAVACAIFPIVMFQRKKVKLAIITLIVGLGLTVAALLISLIPTPGLWLTTMVLPIILFIPYIWCFISGRKH